MRTIAPHTVVFSDIGPDIRWVGNEKGIAGDPDWDLLDTAGFTRGAGAPPADTLNHGNQNGANWIPAESDVSIRPGWFYHAEEDEKVKTPEQLFDLYLKSVGRGSALLLNVPPDRRGLINDHDSAALMGFKRLREESFRNNDVTHAAITLEGKPVPASRLTDNSNNTFVSLPKGGENGLTFSFNGISQINCVMLREPIQMGQRIISFKIVLLENGKVVKEVEGRTIGHKRILTFPTVGCDAFKVVVDDAKAAPLISEVGAYKIPDELVE
jgi:alpha-L-fucosidase